MVQVRGPGEKRWVLLGESVTDAITSDTLMQETLLLF